MTVLVQRLQPQWKIHSKVISPLFKVVGAAVLLTSASISQTFLDEFEGFFLVNVGRSRSQGERFLFFSVSWGKKKTIASTSERRSRNEVCRFCSSSTETDLAATFASKWVSRTTTSTNSSAKIDFSFFFFYPFASQSRSHVGRSAVSVKVPYFPTRSICLSTHARRRHNRFASLRASIGIPRLRGLGVLPPGQRPDG